MRLIQLASLIQTVRERVKRKFGLRYTTVKESTLSLSCSLNLPGSLFKYSIRSMDGAQESQQLCDCACSALLHRSYQKQTIGRNISEHFPVKYN